MEIVIYIDRFKYDISGNSRTWTQSQSTDVPTGQGFAKSLKWIVQLLMLFSC